MGFGVPVKRGEHDGQNPGCIVADQTHYVLVVPVVQGSFCHLWKGSMSNSGKHNVLQQEDTNILLTQAFNLFLKVSPPITNPLYTLVLKTYNSATVLCLVTTITKTSYVVLWGGNGSLVPNTVPLSLKNQYLHLHKRNVDVDYFH